MHHTRARARVQGIANAPFLVNAPVNAPPSVSSDSRFQLGDCFDGPAA
jgi:hypothetical protein